MERYVMRELIDWKESSGRKPLLLSGARQVGKTWLLRELGTRCFENYAEVNFDKSEQLREQFEHGYDLPRILEAIQLQTGTPIVPGKTLLILDEIQECPAALTSLKYFCEDMPELAVAGAGSLLGLTLHQGTGFPVGKVDFVDVYPLCFGEFLDALGQERFRILATGTDTQMIGTFTLDLIRHLKNYYFVGGMPEVVQNFVNHTDYGRVRELQRNILRGYTWDISKHLSGAAAEHTLAAWNSVPAHLGRENKRFVFSHIETSGRARDYRMGITWLQSAGLAIRVPRVSKPGIPLDAYAESSSFKLFALDIGLLGAQARLQPQTLIEGNAVFEEFKGALTEQFVCQELVSFWRTKPFYWSPRDARAEVDFLAERGDQVFAIEAKAEENLRSHSLRSFADKFPHAHALRLSLAGFRKELWMRNVPLYSIENPICWESLTGTD